MNNIICIGDIHWGSINPIDLFNQLNSEFIKYIKKYKDDIEMIVILGDYFDRKLPLTDKSSVLAIKFLNQLCLLCKRNDIQLRLIKGTKTHDFNQLDNFNYLTKQYSFFSIINTVSEEICNDGTKILYVPEEYMNDQDEYYQEFKEKKYDYIFGHGSWDVYSFANQIIESEKPVKGYPVLKYSEWKDSVNKFIVFGHIHVRQHHKKLYYTGSFSRWIHGEEKPKCFIHIKDDKVKFVTNKLAPEYLTIELSDISENELKETLKNINELDDNKHYKIKINENLKLDNLNILKEHVSSLENVNLEIKNKAIMETEKNIEEYDFLGNDVDTNIQKYLKEKNNIELSIEQIEEYCTPEK